MYYLDWLIQLSCDIVLQIGCIMQDQIKIQYQDWEFLKRFVETFKKYSYDTKVAIVKHMQSKTIIIMS